MNIRLKEIINQIKNILFFFLYVLSRPKLLTLLFKSIYLPVYVQYEWLKKFSVGTIIDIGANKGNVTVALATLFPQAHVFSFEPINSECSVIRRKVKNLPNVTVINSALSDKNGKIPFLLNSSSPSSSMLTLSPFGKKIIPCKTTKIIVPAITIDAYFRNKKLKSPIFIKMDVQGAEHIVFHGGKDFLKKVAIIHVETGFEHVYTKQCLFGDIYRLLTNNGFIYHGNMKDADFYPLFTIPCFENSIFIRKEFLKFVIR